VEIINDKEELLLHISETIGKNKVLKLTDILYNRSFKVKDLIQLTYAPQREIAFRAAWILENLVLGNPAKYINDLEYLFARFPDVKNKSCQRHYAKIIMALTGPGMDKAIRQKIDTLSMEPVVERCFDLLTDRRTPVAVKVHCSQFLFNMRLRYAWITDVLTDQMRILMDLGEPAVKAKGRRLLSYLVGD
jgi:hypothetical protein